MRVSIRRFVLIALAAIATLGATADRETCFLKGEREAGMNRICYYDCVSGDAAITIKSTQLCPVTIRR